MAATALGDDVRPPQAHLRPLTDRILALLPGRDDAWILAWALVPWLNALRRTWR